MNDKDFIAKACAFMKARQEAEAEGKQEFECPICGGKAWWSRANGNNHLHSGCKDCGFGMMA